MPNNKCLFVAPPVKTPKFIVFTDLDETYLANQPNEEQVLHLRRLESFIINNCAKQKVLFGWVTGCTAPSILAKIIKYDLEVLPHFIAHSLATELFYFDANNPEGERDSIWQKQLLQSNFQQAMIAKIVDELAIKQETFLTPQKPIYNTKCKVSYYYKQVSKEADRDALVKIRAAADKYHVAVNISRCNPALGDPEDCYDVNWIPKAAGKSQVVRYLIEKRQVSVANTFAFGDSQNDLEMLKAVQYGYLVANAPESAKASFNRVTAKPYAEGILDVLNQHILSVSCS